MKAYFHADQQLHHPRTYLSRGKMRTPQEVPERFVQLKRAAESMGFDVQSPDDAGMAPILDVHDFEYIRFLATAYQEWHELPDDWGEEVISNIFVREPNSRRGILAKAGYYLADGSCPIGKHTWQAVYAGAQCAISAAQAVLNGDKFAYAGSRPPGHHARRDAAGGFCYLNNAAIAAELLRQKHQRVVVLDTDMHHGQGIQEIFYDRNDVYYISIHGDPENFYPVVQGYPEERGEGIGEGFNLNLPMPHHSPESVFFDKLDEAKQAIALYQPGALVLSLGFDIYEKDPQSLVAVSTPGFERLGREMAALGIPVVVVQEGGYDIDSLGANFESFFNGLLA